MAEWSMDEIIKFINRYRQFECLWNFKGEDYKKRDLKKKAWLQLSRENGREIVELKKKIKHLRNAYVVEKKKVDEAKKSETSVEAVYRPHLYYYDDLKFLNSVIVLRRTKSNYVVGDSIECATEAVETELDDSVYTERFDNAINAIVYFAREDERDNINSTFAKCIALQLGQLTPVEAAETMGEIQMLISRKVVESMRSRMQSDKLNAALGDC